jgi:predicted ABC-type ATPase
MEELTRRRCAIVLELSASHASHPGFLRAFSRNGYGTCMIHANVPPELSARRASRRLETDGRHVPPDYVLGRHRKIRKLLPRYRKIVDLFIEAEDASRLDAKAVLGFVRRRG